jgi:chemotaxis protein MotB
LNAGQHNLHKEPPPTQDGWMVTFADLLALLLTFFVLLFSMNTVNFESWKAVVSTMSDEFNQSRPKLALEQRDSSDHLKPAGAAGLNLNYLQVLLERSLSPHASLEGVTVYREADSIVISIPATVLFERKDTQLLSDSVRSLKQLAGTLAQIKNKVRIAGHTDSVPIHSGKYLSNWDLSMARARIVAGILTDFGYRQPITILGFADTANQGFVSTNLDVQNLAKAERVDIIVVPERSQGGLYDLF